MAWAGVLAIRLRPFLFSKKELDLLDAILYEVHTPVRRRGADDDAAPVISLAEADASAAAFATVPTMYAAKTARDMTVDTPVT